MAKGIRIKLSGKPPTVLAFDDDVLECFFGDGSTRIHIIHIKGIELADNKGKYLLTIHLMDKDLYIWVDGNQLAPVKELIDQIKQAMASSQS